jgi:hypothetical protein
MIYKIECPDKPSGIRCELITFNGEMAWDVLVERSLQSVISRFTVTQEVRPINAMM